MSDDECTRHPGRAYPTHSEAEAAILDRRIKRAAAGQVAEPGTHTVEGCRCGGFHVVTAEKSRQRARKDRQRAANRR